MALSAVKPRTHTICRSTDPSNLVWYQVGENEKTITRPVVSDSMVPWSVDYRDYKPIKYTSPIVLKSPFWADPLQPNSDTRWNSVDKQIDRRSHLGLYAIAQGLPRNPVGRTGIEGRGLLGKWGPNHAADPIVTRWKLNPKGMVEINAKSKKPILQFVAVERKDTKEWAVPGGMCDPGEKISQTLKREFMEEALDSQNMNEKEREKYYNKLSDLFKNGTEIYRGYVDDPRNTDNAWMETIAVNFHDDNNLFGNLKLSAGDDAGKVCWMDIHSGLRLYASHSKFIHQVALLHNADW
ncbi:ADP-ribose mitochondrial [Brachionus plicatilis]|uniref:ADP-ribose mitochondrial n=1 Tax=Brachionus plicatilis TaxID=10195 RepID=A0A3M7P6A9_BRAPC|nr:ADP-ribose mitochondrial [Brachionus plicatilis]